MSNSNISLIYKSLIFSVIIISNKSAYAEDLSNIRNIIANAPENSWIQVNTNKFSDAWLPDRDNNKAVIEAWSSFAWDSNRGDLLIFGGGHANYSGNEMYRWRASTQEWELASLPSKIDVNDNYLPVGGAEFAPQSSHTYDNAEFLPLADRFVTFGGNAWPWAGNFYTKNPDGTIRRTGPYFFDPAKADSTKVGGSDGSGVDPNTPGGYMWENRDIYTNLVGDTLAPHASEGTTDYALENGKEVLYISGPQGGGTEHMLAKLTINDYNDPSLDEWQILGVDWRGSSGHGAGIYDPINNLYIKTYNTTTQFSFWNLDNASPTLHNSHATLVSAPDNFVMNGQYGMEYDPIRDRILLWGQGGEVFQLIVGDKFGQNWTVAQLPNEQGDHPYDYSVESKWDNNAVLGKWHYASDLDVFVALQGSIDGNVWFYKPEGWVNTAVVPIPGGFILMLSGISFLFSRKLLCRMRSI